MSLESVMVTGFKELLERKSDSEKEQILSVSQQAFFEVPTKLMLTNGEPFKLSSGKFLTMGDFLGSNHWTIKPDLAHGYIMAQLWSGLVTGEIQSFVIEADGTPTRDTDRVGNQAKVSNLPNPFSAEVWQDGHNQLEDGKLTWSESLTDFNSEVRPVNTAPLEIGSCNLTTIWNHLGTEGAICRYPYGVNYLILLLTKPAQFRDSFPLNWG